MEDHELKELRIAEIGQQAEELGLEWHHLPIADLSVPGSAFETTWQYLRRDNQDERVASIKVRVAGSL